MILAMVRLFQTLRKMPHSRADRTSTKEKRRYIASTEIENVEPQRPIGEVSDADEVAEIIEPNDGHEERTDH